MHVSIRKAVDWIAQNDEPGEMNLTPIAESITCLLVADLFGKGTYEIAGHILRRRKELNNARRN